MRHLQGFIGIKCVIRQFMASQDLIDEIIFEWLEFLVEVQTQKTENVSQKTEKYRKSRKIPKNKKYNYYLFKKYNYFIYDSNQIIKIHIYLSSKIGSAHAAPDAPQLQGVGRCARHHAMFHREQLP